MDLGRAMERAQVLDWSLQEQLRPHMSRMKPRRSIYIPEFIAANQESRADNVLAGTMAEQVEHSHLTSHVARATVRRVVHSDLSKWSSAAGGTDQS